MHQSLMKLLVHMLHTFGRKKRNTTCGQLFSISSGFLLSLLLLP